MHVPVMLGEALKYLDPKPNENFIDATAGEGGHSFAILERINPQGRILAIDRDSSLVEALRERAKERGLEERLIVVHGNFRNLRAIATREGFEGVAGVLFDLGLSSWHLESSGRGFSFLRDEALDMRFNPEEGISAAELINKSSLEEFTLLLRRYGDEPSAQEIAYEIIRRKKVKPIERTKELAELVEAVKGGAKGRTHPATRTFQALRIVVNDELGALTEALPQALEILEPAGHLVIISFHSGEDRTVKRFFAKAHDKLRILTSKPIRPSREEIKTNPRARSAKLRAAQKL